MALVLWGTNLSSTVGFPKYSQFIRNIIKLPPFHKDVVIGLILSDCWLQFSSPAAKNVRLGFKQSIAHFEYFWHVYTILAHFCSNIPISRISIRAGVKNYSIELQTRSLPCFTLLHHKFYNTSNKKVIPPVDIMYELLTPVALAHWIMGDGVALSHGLAICTESYTTQEIILLVNILIVRYGIECTLRPRGNSYRIYIRERSMPLLRTIVGPYIIPAIFYKLRI